MSPFLFGLLVIGGAALIVMGILLRSRERERDLAAILDLPFGERDVIPGVLDLGVGEVAEDLDGAGRAERGAGGRAGHGGPT